MNQLVDLAGLDPTLKLDIRYATSENFLGRAVYSAARAFLQKPAADSLIRVHRALAAKGLGLCVFDGYRPWSVTKLFWESIPDESRLFFADPALGSRHNRGCAVDLTLFDLASGLPLEMPSHFDEMTERSAIDYEGGLAASRANRDLLRKYMTDEGFLTYRYEWWHYDHPTWMDYPVLDLRFEELDQA